ncbi:MAG: RNA polymerase sigma factor [Lachnospiraceae bacterium]|nr:RNA polymerase sigma factor [Lachnospiraceae bacterium]
METDEEVYIRYRKEDNDADLETLLVRHKDGLLLFLLGYVRCMEDAEEILMDTFARLAVNKPHFETRKKGSFRSWLYAIGRNNALMHIRKKKIQLVPLDESIPSANDLPDFTLLEQERNRKLYQALQKLKPEYRQALTLSFLEGLSHEEIAQAMGLRIRQIYNLMDRGKKSLKKELEEMGITDAKY